MSNEKILTNFRDTVATIKEMNALENCLDGQIVYCEEESKYYIYNKQWTALNIENSGLQINLYDLNKNIIEQLKPMKIHQINEKLSLFNNYLLKTQNKHYMLLCKEYSYYTIFENDYTLSLPTFSGAVCEIITQLGDIMSIELTESKDAIEIWIRPKEEEEAMVFYLFAYDAGVVYYG